MIEFINNLPENVVGIKVSGTVTKKEYEDKFTPEMKERLSGKKEINYLVLLSTKLSNFEAGVWWDDFKLALEYYSRWRKVAIVSDDVTVARLMNLAGFMIPGKHKCFSLSEYEMAVAWLMEY